MAALLAAGRWWRSRTGCTPPTTPTGSRWSSTAGSPSWAVTHELVAADGEYAALWRAWTSVAAACGTATGSIVVGSIAGSSRAAPRWHPSNSSSRARKEPRGRDADAARRYGSPSPVAPNMAREQGAGESAGRLAAEPGGSSFPWWLITRSAGDPAANACRPAAASSRHDDGGLELANDLVREAGGHAAEIGQIRTPGSPEGAAGRWPRRPTWPRRCSRSGIGEPAGRGAPRRRLPAARTTGLAPPRRRRHLCRRSERRDPTVLSGLRTALCRSPTARRPHRLGWSSTRPPTSVRGRSWPHGDP